LKEIHHNGHTLEMYDSIDELPVTRFLEYNVMLSIDAGIGGDMESAARHIIAIRRYNAKGDKEKVDQEARNLYQNLAFCVGHTNPEMTAFVALIHRMNGRPITDLSSEGVQRVIRELGHRGFTIGKMRGFLTAVKKKLKPSLRSFFRPSRIQQN